jgi:hypothetical protein
MGDGGWHLPSKTICPECGKPIRRTKHDSYSCPAPDHKPRHFRCVYPPAESEMAVTRGDE